MGSYYTCIIIVIIIIIIIINIFIIIIIIIIIINFIVVIVNVFVFAPTLLPVCQDEQLYNSSRVTKEKMKRLEWASMELYHLQGKSVTHMY